MILWFGYNVQFNRNLPETDETCIYHFANLSYGALRLFYDAAGGRPYAGIHRTHTGRGCSYDVAVDTGSEKWTAFDPGTAFFQGVHGAECLVGRKSHNAYSYARQWDTIPSSAIRKMLIEHDVEISTGENTIYEAKAGDWEIEQAGEKSWAWHASYAVEKSTADDSESVATNVTIPKKGVYDFNIITINGLGTGVIVFLGIACLIGFLGYISLFSGSTIF